MLEESELMNIENDNVQYIYDGSQMVLESSEELNNFVFEDGTRAVFVNGSLMTADGQTLVLQEEGDLSQYCIDGSTGEILIPKDQEQSVLAAVPGQDHQNVIQYIETEDGEFSLQDGGQNGSNQVLYINGERVTYDDPQSFEYELAELESENNGIPMKMVKLENQGGTEGVIDLEELLSQQGLVEMEGGNYQYAILKDGKLHLQQLNPQNRIALQADIEEQEPIEAKPQIENNFITLTKEDEVDLSRIKGRNLLTGQPITLSRYMDKIQSRIVNNVLKGADLKLQGNKVVETKATKYTPSNQNLNKLINKKLHLGTTDNGKLLIGKIVHVLKKSTENVVTKTRSFRKTKVNKNSKKKDLLKNKNLSRQINEVINTVEDEKEYVHMDNDNSNPRELSRESNVPTHNTADQNSDDDLKIVLPSVEPSQSNENSLYEPPDCTSQNDLQPEAVIKTKPTENPKVLIQNKVVLKKTFEQISKTLSGLMNMESCCRKLRNKTIILKVIEKIYDHDMDDYTKRVSFCSGFMVREYQLNQQANQVSESWKFLLDSNSKDTIFGESRTENLRKGDNKLPLKQTANLTVQITIWPMGNRTTRVIINPPSMFRCKQCDKGFKTSSLLKVHVNNFHPPVNYNCTTCSSYFDTAEAFQNHKQMHQPSDTKGMYECMECNKRFATSYRLRKHMDIHFKPVECVYCKEKFMSATSLKNHLPVHLDPDQIPRTPEEVHVYCCSICGRQFSRQANLQRHVEIHKGEGAMYKCAVCSSFYHYVSSLTRHVVQNHITVRNKELHSPNDQEVANEALDTLLLAEGSEDQENLMEIVQTSAEDDSIMLQE